MKEESKRERTKESKKEGGNLARKKYECIEKGKIVEY